MKANNQTNSAGKRGDFTAQSNYYTRMKKQGLVRVGVWCRKKDRKELLEFAEELRQRGG